ncbi:MAG: hypothetical protein NC541_12395 [bacterium]|nr:hypothetical protein [bacterium]
MQENRKQNNAKYALAAFWATLIFVILYKYVLNDLETDMSDLIWHTEHAGNIYMDRLLESWLRCPYLLWHLCVKSCIKFLGMPINEAAAFVYSDFALLNYFLTFYLLDRTVFKLTDRDAGFLATCVPAILMLVQPMYVRWFNGQQYFGQFSMNPIHNPTQMAVKPFGLLCFMLAVDLIRSYKKEEALYFPGIRSRKWLYVIFSANLFLSALVKPTFLFMLLPAGVLYLLTELAAGLWKKEKNYKGIWDFTWKMALASVPALLYLALVYVAFYHWGGIDRYETHVAVYPFLTVWHLYSPDVPTSLILSMSFPFWMVLTNWKYFLRSVEGRISVIGYAVGTLEFSFIVETGYRLSQANFVWPMLSGMLLLWVTGAAYLVHLTLSPESGKWRRTVIVVGWLLLFVHLFSGLYYISPNTYII